MQPCYWLTFIGLSADLLKCKLSEHFGPDNFFYIIIFYQHNIFPQIIAFVFAPFYEFSKCILWNLLLFFKLSILPLYSDSNEVDWLTWRKIYRIFHLFMPFLTCVWSPLDHMLLTDRWLLTAMNGLSTHREQHSLLGQSSPGSAILLSKVKVFYYPRSRSDSILFSFGGDQDLAIVIKWSKHKDICIVTRLTWTCWTSLLSSTWFKGFFSSLMSDMGGCGQAEGLTHTGAWTDI